MTEKEEHRNVVEQFSNGLTKVVELGYGDDECDPAVTVMFEELVRKVVPQDHIDRLPFKMPSAQRPEQNTHAYLLARSVDLERFVERIKHADSVKPESPILFPFLATLALSGGLFILVAQTTRLAAHYL